MWPLLVSAAAALAMHLFVAQVAGSRHGAVLAAVIWGTSAYSFAGPDHLQFQAFCVFLPLTFLCLHRLMAARRTRDALVLGVLAGLQVMTAVDFAAVGGLGLVAGGVVLAAASSRRGVGRVAAHLVLAAAVAGIIAVPVVGLAALTGRRVPLAAGLEGAMIPGFVLFAPALSGIWFGWRTDARPLVAVMVAVGLTGHLVLVMIALATLTALGWRECSAEAHRARA